MLRQRHVGPVEIVLYVLAIVVLLGIAYGVQWGFTPAGDTTDLQTGHCYRVDRVLSGKSGFVAAREFPCPRNLPS